MRDLPLVALRAFAAVYDAGGVRPAARRLRISHSSVSRHLRELEAWLGSALFDRQPGPRGLGFTPQGEALGKAALASLSDLARAVDAVREQRRANAVTVATTASFAARWLLPRLHLLQAAHPGIQVSVIAEQAPAPPGDQGADIAVRMGEGPWEDGDCAPLMDEELYPVASPDYWRRLAGADAAEKLGHAALIHDRDPAAAWERWFQAHPCPGVDLRAGARLTSSDLVLRAAAQGLGVALARGRLASDDVETGLLLRPFGAVSVRVANAYWVLTPKGAAPRAASRAVVDWLAEQAEVRLPPIR